LKNDEVLGVATPVPQVGPVLLYRQDRPT